MDEPNGDEPLKELLQYSTPEGTYLKSSPSSSLYHESGDSDLARVLNSDLSINHITTLHSAAQIWSNLNLRCVEKFGKQDHITENVSISDITWASVTLPAYRSWNMMRDYYVDIDKWIAKIENFCKSNLSNSEIVLDYQSFYNIKYFITKFSRYCKRY